MKNTMESLDEKFYELTHVLFPSTGPSVPKVIQFTSCHHLEGVTTVAVAYASFLAKTFSTDAVLVLEANPRKPILGKLFRLDVKTGLVNALMNRVLIESAIYHVESHQFSAVPAGQLGPISAAEYERTLFTRMPELVRHLSDMYRCILIDSPPVIPYVDSTLISSCVDGVVIVVEAGATPSEVVDHAINKLKSAQATILGMVLNKREYFIPKWVYRFI